FNLQIGLSLLKNKNSVENSFKLLRQDAEAFFRAMPFEPTDAQKRAVAEIYEDFKSETPANRLLQGDVGSGKTLVAAAGMVATAQSGYQSVLMAPTEILAVQHANTLAKLLKPFHLNIALLTASVKGKERTAVLKKIAEGEADIIVGTHAVLGDKVNFARLAFAVTDEQHRFGVRQRMQLANKAEKSPHVLVMSATPIPRTLGLLLFAELDISILDELPKGRQTVKTYLVNTALRARMFAFIEKHAKMGHQTFIVCPLVEESETMTDVMSLMTYYETIAKPMLPNCRVAVIHGKMKATEKAQIMQDFANKKYDVLCSTTVIEVGVDVPNATVMVIENAERYGVSSLHQLRGRVGRGNDESFCVLVSDSKSETAKERLNLLCKTHDGFKLAEYDMKTRGVGDFFGNRQHGLPTLKVANLLTDTQILYITQTEANKILKADPNLENHPLIRQNVDALFNMDKGGVTY
ncbi:MAG: ATP-dependent DNA helicase RecG, partial [Oscillospiraceae bacterium]